MTAKRGSGRAPGVRRVAAAVAPEVPSTPVRGTPDRVRLTNGVRGGLPMDMGAVIGCNRVLGPMSDGAEGLVGHEIILDLYNADSTHIVIKKYRGDGVKVLVNDVEVWSWKKMDGGETTQTTQAGRGRRSAVARAGRQAAPVKNVVGSIGTKRKAPEKTSGDDDFE